MARRFARKAQDKLNGNDGVEEAPPPLFTLERQDEKRIMSWSPDPFEEDGAEQAGPVVESPEAGDPKGRAVAPKELQVDPNGPTHGPVRAAPPSTAKPAVPRRDVASGARGESARTNGVDRIESMAPAAAAARSAAGASEGERPERRRGRPRGRAIRRQVHFHVDPAEEQLLMAAVAMFGSQQKGLIAALESLQEAELLRDEIERLQAECERQRELLAGAEALFNKS